MRAIDLGERIPALRGFVISPEGITGPSGTLYRFEGDPMAHVRTLARQLRRLAPGVPRANAVLAQPLVDALREMVEATTHIPAPERGVAAMAFAWVVAETTGATWASIAEVST